MLPSAYPLLRFASYKLNKRRLPPLGAALLFGTVALSILLSLSGCGMFGGRKKGEDSGTPTSSSMNQFNLMVTQKTALNKQGPDQTTPPESYLSAGTRIRIVQNLGASVEIETINGEKGYIASSDVGPLMQ